MSFTLKISWVKLFLALALTVMNGYFVVRLRNAEEKYQQGIEHIRYVQGELFLLQEQQREINETYTQTWAQQTKTAEMMYELGNDICDKRRGILKKFPNVAKQSPKVQANPWE